MVMIKEALLIEGLSSHVPGSVAAEVWKMTRKGGGGLYLRPERSPSRTFRAVDRFTLKRMSTIIIWASRMVSSYCFNMYKSTSVVSE